MTTEEQARDAMNLSRHLKERIGQFEEHIGALERRIVVLEAFHHWAATQVFIEFRTRLEKLEPQNFSRQLGESERIQQIQHTVEHLQNHPPFAGNYPTDGTLDSERASGARNKC